MILMFSQCNNKLDKRTGIISPGVKTMKSWNERSKYVLYACTLMAKRIIVRSDVRIKLNQDPRPDGIDSNSRIIKKVEKHLNSQNSNTERPLFD